ncbi:DEAD/DEAH box helicase [Solirhodobacter olei]|uniref:DEAD/DEAH box helicase n=1 Tax=Solirhodobacter olei TaxID=2493082 RepID=UPI0013E35E05|nr:DEAD/DEAH box helicase [Solirhodobacter olei]
MAVALAAHFDRATLERAQVYFHAGFVLAVAPDGTGGVTSRVSNGRGTTYQQTIGIETPSSRHRNGRIHGLCTCPVHINCKHVAAALYALASGGAQAGNDAAPRLSGPVQSWIGRARAIKDVVPPAASFSSPRPEDYPDKIKDRLVYVLDCLQPGFRIDLHKARVSAKGIGLNATIRRYDLFHQLRASRTTPEFLRPVDLELAGTLARARCLAGQYGYGSELPDVLQKQASVGAALMRSLCATGRLFGEPSPQAALEWSDVVNEPVLGWTVAVDGSQTLRFLTPEGDPLDVGRFGEDGLWIDRNSGRIGRLAAPVSDEILRLVRDCPALEPSDARALGGGLPATLGPMPLPAPHMPGEIRRSAQIRQVRLVLAAATAREGYARRAPTVTLPTVAVFFIYEGQAVAAWEDASPRFVEGSDLVTLERDREWEATVLARLQLAGAVPVETLEQYMPGERMTACDFVFAQGEFNPLTLEVCRSSDALRFAFHEVPRLRAEGWAVEITSKWPYRLEEAETQLVVSTATQGGERFLGHGWFDLGFKVEIAGRLHDLAPLIAAVLSQLGGELDASRPPDLETLHSLLADRPVFIDLGKGTYASVDLSPIARVLHLFLQHHADPERLHPAEATLAAEAEAVLAGSPVKFADHAGILPLARNLQALRGVASVAPPRGLKADLRGYQALGAAWMGSLIRAGFGGVLADDMGLGKTLQVLALLQARKEQGAAQGPALLVVPTSLLHGWQEQSARFTPELDLLILHGTRRGALLDRIGTADLVVTTYPLLGRDREVLSDIAWDLVIIDEAQTLKNPAAQMAKALRDIPARGRLALTGTPMENSLQDLWTLFDWVVPGLLGDRKTFQSVFRTPIEKQGDRVAQARLNRRLKPFLLRRTKEEVAAELPPRTEILDQVDLPKPQQALYETVRSVMDVRVREAVAARGLAAARITILDALLKLRQVCCDPALVKTDAARTVKDSAKRARLRELLQELVAEGRRVLVFSQFVEMLELIAADLDALRIKHLMLTGQTTNRPEILRAFKEGAAPVFLLSLKAGGVGLTLTEADTVILYDPWWNPAVERQAMDRVHRIGQDKPVFVHRLVASATVEEKILQLQAKKQALADALFAEGNDGTTEGFFDEDVIADLFAPLTGQ